MTAAQARNEALFVISTGRCGTQWLAEVLQRAAGASVRVDHEPLGDDYPQREMLAGGSPGRLDSGQREILLDHVAAIEKTLETTPYIECGHPLWSSLPYLLSRFEGRVRVIHLVRHPVPTAWSWMTQRAYTRPPAPHLSERVLLSPFDRGIRFESYRDRWSSLTPYEKALFYWAEVNHFALRTEGEAGVPWLRVRAEDLFEGRGMQVLMDFAGVSSDGFDPAELSPVDKYRFLAEPCDPRLIERHPEIMDLARQLGYDPLAFNESAMRTRYLGAPAVSGDSAR